MQSLILVGLFWPLFPLSLVFNRVHALLGHAVPRAVLIVIWPQLGLLAISRADGPPPDWLVWWAVLSAVLYSFRILTVRDVYTWVGFLATAQWSLLWLLPDAAWSEPYGDPSTWGSVLAVAAPLGLLVLLAGALDRRFGAAYTHVYGGLGVVMPRLSVLLTLGVLAAVATPVFPTFFVLLRELLSAPSVAVVAAVLTAALVWSWAGFRLLQGLVVGSPDPDAAVTDVPRVVAGAALVALVGLLVAGIYLSGEIA